MRFKSFNGIPVKKQREFFADENGRRVKKIKITFYRKDPADPTGQANLKMVVSEEDWQKNATDVFSDECRNVAVRQGTVVHS